MKKKGLIVALFFAVLMLTSLAASVFLPNRSQNGPATTTGTPSDNFPDDKREQFCGSSNAKSTPFVKEYKIPTDCTNPLAVVSDPSGNVWFAQTNTGKVAKFDPASESFTEFDNPTWPANGRSMIWGIDYSPDGSLWFTDDTYDSVWQFSINDQQYRRISYPSNGDTLPQKLKVDGSQIVINDFNGNKMTFLDPTSATDSLKYLSLPSLVNGSVTGAFAIDTNHNVWYTNWIFQQGGILVKFNQEEYRSALSKDQGKPLSFFDYAEIVSLPPQLLTPNGMSVSSDGTLWLADTTSSSVFNFDPATKQFTQYVTSDPKLSTYGNSTGVIKSPISRPYWIKTSSEGNLIFNEQTSNNIAVLDPKSESLIEYMVPSKNPAWGDCDGLTNCGLAQIFDFTIHKDKIWFTEWVENNIGVVDTTVALPLEIKLDSKIISLTPGESKNLSFTTSSKEDLSDISLILSDPFTFLDITSNVSGTFHLNANESKTINVTISASSDATPGTYKVLLGSQIENISVSKFVTVTILP